MGIDIGHHHSHEHFDSFGHQTHESINPEYVNPIDESADVSEHEHTQHAHTPAHPLLVSAFVSQFFQSDTLFETDKHYQNCLYSPPLPPPHLA